MKQSKDADFIFQFIPSGHLFLIASALPIDHDDLPSNLGAPRNGNANKLNVGSPLSGFALLAEKVPTSLPKFPNGRRGVWYTVDDKNGEESTVWMKTHNWDQRWFSKYETVPSNNRREAYIRDRRQ